MQTNQNFRNTARNPSGGGGLRWLTFGAAWAASVLLHLCWAGQPNQPYQPSMPHQPTPAMRATPVMRTPPPSQGSAGLQQSSVVQPQHLSPTLQPVQGVPAGQMSLVVNDRCVSQVLGGSVYSTGTDDVFVRIIWEPGYPKKVGLALPADTNPEHELHSGQPPLRVFLLSPGPPRYLGWRTENGKLINLGRLPPGEIVFGLQEQNVFLRTGEGTGNPGNLPYAILRTYSSGTLEAWFEDGIGSADDRDFLNAVLQITGGVANNNAVAQLLKVIKEEKAETRQKAIESLKAINPRALSLVEVR